MWTDLNKGQKWRKVNLERLSVAQRADILPQCSADRRDKAAGPDFSWLPFLGVLEFRTSFLLGSSDVPAS